MKYITLDGSGNQSGSGNTDGGGSSTGESYIDLGYYWPTGAYPTSMTPNALTITNGSTVATTQKYTPMGHPGTVISIEPYVFGTTGGYQYTWTLYKNGVATSLTTSTTQTANGAAPVGRGTVAFVSGDILQIYSQAASGATSQATSCGVTAVLQ